MNGSASLKLGGSSILKSPSPLSLIGRPEQRFKGPSLKRQTLMKGERLCRPQCSLCKLQGRAGARAEQLSMLERNSL